MGLDWIGISFLLGIVAIILTFRFKKTLLKNIWDYLKIFGVGGLIYPIISSSYYVAMGERLWNDTFDFRIIIGVGVLFYIGYIIDLYKSKNKKKKSKKKNGR